MPRSSNTTSLTKKSQITLTKEVRGFLGVKPGDRVSFKIEGSEVKIVAEPSLLDRNFGSVKPRKRPENTLKRRESVMTKIAEDVVGEAR